MQRKTDIEAQNKKTSKIIMPNLAYKTNNWQVICNMLHVNQFCAIIGEKIRLFLMKEVNGWVNIYLLTAHYMRLDQD